MNQVKTMQCRFCGVDWMDGEIAIFVQQTGEIVA